MQNRTIAFNTAIHGKHLGSYYAPGLEAVLDTATLQSSILSNNTYGTFGTPSVENDFDAPLGIGQLQGANNLIRVATTPTPGGTINGCPLLGTLRNNGGPTLTHALLSKSAALDAGNDVAIDPATGQPLAYDQRGAARVSPSSGTPDFGAYEVQKDDIVFNSGVDGCH